MLHPWAAVQDVAAGASKASQSKSTASAHAETTEQREHRLRAIYESALSAYTCGHIQSAHSSFRSLVHQLSPSSTKRKRPDTAQWVRRLRYVAFKNLAETSHGTDALYAFASALDDDASDVSVWLSAAKAAASVGYLHVARRAYEAALSVRPTNQLAITPYRAVLAAIGDVDDDTDVRYEVVETFIKARRQALRSERNETEQEVEEVERVKITELSWNALVDAVCTALHRRLNGMSKFLVAAPVTFDAPDPPYDPLVIDAEDDVVVVCTPPTKRARISDKDNNNDNDNDTDMIVISPSSTPAPAPAPPQRQQQKKESVPVLQSVNLDDDDDDDPVPVATVRPIASAVQPSVGKVSEKNGGNGSKAREKKKEKDKDKDKDKPEVRRSARRANSAALAEAERRTSRQSGELILNQGEDAQMIQALLKVMYDSQDTDEVHVQTTAATNVDVDGNVIADDSKKSTSNEHDTNSNTIVNTNTNGNTTMNASASAKTNETVEPRRTSTWKNIIQESDEALVVHDVIRSLDRKPCGLAEFLLRVLTRLSSLKVAQYFSTLALLWLTVRERLDMDSPGDSHVTVHVIEALMVSGKKTSKQKLRRFHEAGRLLSQLRLDDITNDIELSLLAMRVAWLRVMLHDYRAEMQRAFYAAERSLDIALRLSEKKQLQSVVVPALAGSELSGYSWDTVETVIRERMGQMKSARDMEKAQEELNKASANDRESARRTMSILAPSVRSTVRSLALHKWSDKDFCLHMGSAHDADAWDMKLEAEVDLDERLKLLSNACEQADDVVGELICFAIHLRMAVHAYAARLRAEQKPVAERDSDYTESSATRIADILTQIRKFVFNVKKIASTDSAHLWTATPGLTGWSTKDAAFIMASAIVSLTEMIVTMIPFAKHTSAAVELGQLQKKRRLGFTRCMLAFPRCIYVLHKCREHVFRSTTALHQQTNNDTVATAADESLTRKMLYVSAFCLRALEVRGCLREEGTSGALIKFYAKYLHVRLREIASAVANDKQVVDNERKRSGSPFKKRDENRRTDTKTQHQAITTHSLLSDESSKSNSNSLSSTASDKGDSIVDPDYDWTDPRVIRHELAQCYECLHRIPELETVSGDSTVLDEERWIENACQVSKHIGMAFIGGDSTGVASTSIEIDVCKSVYLFYRKRIFEAVCRRRRDGGRAKRLREVLQKLTADLRQRDVHDNNPKGVHILSSDTLDEIVSAVVDSTTNDVLAEAGSCVPKLEEEWVKTIDNKKETMVENVKMEDIDNNTDCTTSSPNVDTVQHDDKTMVNNVQLSITYFELFVLHAISMLDTYEVEYKKQKNAERRKRPKEIAEKLQLASKDCIMAVRCRPWSVGAWVLLGRIFVEMADLALDERELCFTTFGLFNPEEVVLLGEGESIQNIFRRAEFCFGFADALARNKWARDKARTRLNIDVVHVLGAAYDGNDDELWYGFGDDMDLFGSFGLSNNTTSRPILDGEPHPLLLKSAKKEHDEDCADQDQSVDERTLAAISLGSAAVKMLRLRELRYFHTHWTDSTLKLNVPSNTPSQYPGRTMEMAETALALLRRGLSYNDASQAPAKKKEEDVIITGLVKANAATDNSTARQDGVSNGQPANDAHQFTRSKHAHNVDQPQWRTGYCPIAKNRWYYSLVEAKLMRKCGRPFEEYLPVFHRALLENTSLRASQKQACDIEPLYKLHSARMKVLRTVASDKNAIDTLTTLERFRYDKAKTMVVDVEDVADDNDWISVRSTAIAEDILKAMQACCENRPGIQYAEFFFKATYCKTLLLSDVLKDTRTATNEVCNLFRIDAAARVLDGGPDGVHRGYLYKMWNYRYSDTGMETAVETERKLVRWRSKLLGLYGSLLQHGKEWRLLAAVIMRLRKKVSDDLPIDGAILDDLIDVYARGRCRAIVLSMERGIVTDAAAFEASYRTTWHIYTETLKLSKEARRVRLAVMREAQGGAGEERIIQSARPRCLVAIHAALRVEHVRWKAAVDGTKVDLDLLRALPDSGRLADMPHNVRALFLESVKATWDRWRDERMAKSMQRRIEDLAVTDGVVARPPPVQAAPVTTAAGPAVSH